jgi:uncharacterized protein (DUF58 family)
VVATLRQVNVRRKLPERICAGDLLLVDLTAENGRSRLGSWAVVVEDAIQLDSVGGDLQRSSVRVMFPFLGAQDERRIPYRCVLFRRGRYRFGPLKVSTRFPFGLLQATMAIGRCDTLIVCPRIGHLTRTWMQTVEADRTGSHRSPRRHGRMEGEFYGLRDWRPGDSQRWIHWRTSAKQGKLAVRQFEQQRHRDVALIVDLWQPRDTTDEQLQNVELAVSFAATAVADLCRRGGIQLSLAIAGTTCDHHSGTASPMLMNEMLERLAVVEAGETNNLPAALGRVLSDARGGARLIVVSTRPHDVHQIRRLKEAGDNVHLESMLSRLAWVDVSGDQLAKLFYMD